MAAVRTLRICGVLAVLLIALAAAGSAPGAESGRFTLRGSVSKVVDGDTIDVRLVGGRRERVRLIGIDTPELGSAQCFGTQARTRARQLALGKKVRLVGDPTQDTRDRYRRLLAYVVLPNGRDVGRQLIADGFGEVYVYKRPFQRVASYRGAEQAAKSADRGLWNVCPGSPLPPPPPPPPPPVGNCHPSYPTVCIPPPP